MGSSDDPLEAKRRAVEEVMREMLTPENLARLSAGPEERERLYQQIADRVQPIVGPPDPDAEPVEAPRRRD